MPDAALDPGLAGEAADAVFAQQATDQRRLLARVGEGDLDEIVAGTGVRLDDLHDGAYGVGGGQRAGEGMPIRSRGGAAAAGDGDARR